MQFEKPSGGAGGGGLLLASAAQQQSSSLLLSSTSASRPPYESWVQPESGELAGKESIKVITPLIYLPTYLTLFSFLSFSGCSFILPNNPSAHLPTYLPTNLPTYLPTYRPTYS